VLEKLLAYGASVTVRSEDNLSPLHLTATLEGGLRCVQLLLDAGADVNSMDDENRTPLLSATCYGWVDIAETLLAAGARIEQTCEDGWTSLTSGIFWNMHGSVKLLLDKGADTLVVTDQGETLLHVAVRYGDIKMLEMLAGRDLGPLDLYAKTGAGETVHDIEKSRDESSDWQKAFQMLLKSIDDRKSASLPVSSVRLESSETLVDGKIAQEVFVTTYAGSDSGSELDHFEDALEIVV
jgi:ankyrin repeat protein